MRPRRPLVNTQPRRYTPAVFPLWKQAIETIFTAFLVPALCVPLVWGVLALRDRHRRIPGDAVTRRLFRLQGFHALSCALLVAGGVLAWTGVPVERGGRPLTILAWALYGIANLLFAALAIRMTTGYSGLPDEAPKDKLFLGFLGLVTLQPIATAGALSLLYRLLRVVYHEEFPWPHLPNGPL
jgi:hypothetical protein